MKNVVRNSCLIAVLMMCFFQVNAQKKSDVLSEEQKKLEKKLATTKTLLEKVKSSKQSSINELKLAQNQVRDREALVQNVDNQIRGAELTISSKTDQLSSLQNRVGTLKNQYKKLLLYAYKHRSRHGKMMYIVSSSNYFEAVKRNAYLKRIAGLQQKQFKLIQQNKKSVYSEIYLIKDEKQRKEALLLLKIEERNLVLVDKQEKEKTLAKFKKDEAKLQAEVKETERKKAEVKKKIKQAIEKEIAAAEAKAKKATVAKKETTSTKEKTTTTTTSKKETVVTETKESLALGKSFESNRGKLPWPVLKGTITESYGKNPHPTLTNVFTNNNGIDIGAPKNAQVRAVFEGEVSSVIAIPGAGKVVIIKHGNYRTVYSNLQDVFVSVGAKITTKQAIGSLLSDDDGTLSTSHFEIHQIINGAAQRVNPSLWLMN